MERIATRTALAATLALGLTLPAAAQIQPDVTMNPNATGSKVLLYPGGKYGRMQKSLLQPGEPDPNAPVVLHKPRKHKKPSVAQTATKPNVQTAAVAAPPPQEQYGAPPPPESAASLLYSAPPKPQRPKPAAANPKPVAQTTPPKPVAQKPKPAPPRAPPAAPAIAQTQPAPPPPRVASIESDVSQRSSILFAPGAEEPPVSALDTVKGMAANLSAALWSGTANIQLEAYGGAHGDKSSEARRLSLKRALIIRQLLIDDGIPSERIVVRAMGGANSGALDRVDIFVAS